MQDERVLYKLFNSYSDVYSYLIVCLSCESIHSYSEKIKKELLSMSITNAYVIFDQLLITGNTSNRFLSIEFKNKEFLYYSAKNIIVDMNYKKITSNFLRENVEFLNSSVLSNIEKKLIFSGCDI